MDGRPYRRNKAVLCDRLVRMEGLTVEIKLFFSFLRYNVDRLQ